MIKNNLQNNINNSNIEIEGFKKRKLYIFFSIISGLIIAWSLTYNFTHIARDIHPASTNETNLKFYFGQYSWFFYFTTISNILFFLVTTVRIFYREKLFNDQMQIIVGTYMLIVGIIYWSVIAPNVWGNAIKAGKTSMFAPNWFFIGYIFNDFTLHFTTVVFALILALSGIKKMNYNFKNQILKVITFPLIYYIFAWALYSMTFYYKSNGAAYIYNFLNFFSPFEIKNLTILYIVLFDIAIFIVVLSLFIIIHYLLIKINAHLYNKAIIKETPINIIKDKTTVIQDEIPAKVIKQKVVLQVKPKKTVKNKTSVKNKANIGSKYIIQKSNNNNGWELKKVGGKRATFVASTKSEVQTYYNEVLKSKMGTTVIEKGIHGKIKNVKKFK